MYGTMALLYLPCCMQLQVLDLGGFVISAQDGLPVVLRVLPCSDWSLAAAGSMLLMGLQALSYGSSVNSCQARCSCLAGWMLQGSCLLLGYGSLQLLSS